MRNYGSEGNIPKAKFEQKLRRIQGVSYLNIMVERLWRSVRYENIYPKGYQLLPEANEGLKLYFSFYNGSSPHQGLNYQTPADVYPAI